MGSKNHQLTKTFLGFIDNVNKAGAGTVQIKFLGGPEVAKPPKQPIAKCNGLIALEMSGTTQPFGLLLFVILGGCTGRDHPGLGCTRSVALSRL